MGVFKRKLIQAGLETFAATGLHHVLGPWTRGRGAILTFHHVRPWVPRAFAPNRLLEITPDYLDAVIRRIRALGYDIVALDEMLPRLHDTKTPPFVALTFDDGYRDTLIHAVPVLERHNAPFCIFVTTGFAEGSAPLWWLELEEIIRVADNLTFALDDDPRTVRLRTTEDKGRGFDLIAGALIAKPPDALHSTMASLREQAGVPDLNLTSTLCMGWKALQTLAEHPLCTIGCHALSHPNLARLDDADLRLELTESRAAIERHLGRPIRHFAYPYGSIQAAGIREFSAARDAGFVTAVTTRPGTLFRTHADTATALPRISVNGLYRDVRFLDVLLSGAPFALWNAGRRHR